VMLAALPGGGLAGLALALAGTWAFGWHMTWQIGKLNIDDPASCLRVFHSNRDAGLLAALFLAIAASL